MILKKPYAFFIKMFKPMHFFMSVLILYLIYMSNSIYRFLTEYIYSTEIVTGQEIKSNLVNNLFFLIPVLLIIFLLIFLGVMYKKQKPVLFYVINIFVIIVIIVINFYTSNFLGIMEENIISIKTVKLIHDLILINMIIESVLFIFFLIRGLGINIKKFNFESDIAKLNINESDKEEFELDINVNFDENKRKRKERLRKFKYLYHENKFIVNILIFIFLVLIIIFTSLILVFGLKKYDKEGIVYNASKFSFIVNETFVIEESFSGKKLEDKYLLVVDIGLQTNKKNLSIDLNDFVINIENIEFFPSNKYNNYLFDIGNVYKKENLTSDVKNYIVIYEISKKYIDGNVILTCAGTDLEIKLNPKEMKSPEKNIQKNIGEQIKFEQSLEKINFTINSFDIKEKYLIQYNYCVSDNDCLLSKEYLKASLDQSFNKYLLKLDVDYKNDSDLNILSFYDFFSKFGSLYYKIGEKWYIQNNSFEEVKSKKIVLRNNVYIGVNSNVSNASEIKLVFKIRNTTYEYKLK